MRGALVVIVAIAWSAGAQDALVVAAHADRLESGNGGGVSVAWVHPRANDTFVAGASFLSLPGTRWAFATFGDTRRLSTRTMVNAEANLGGGSDDRGRFHYLLLRAGVTRELLPRQLYAEAEWLQADVARQQDGILRLGGTWMPQPPLTVRASLYESLFGDSNTRLAMLRADYDFGRVTALGGISGGTAHPVLLQQSGADSTRIREAFGGVSFDAASRRWTVVASTLSAAGERRHRIAVSCRMPLR